MIVGFVADIVNVFSSFIDSPDGVQSSLTDVEARVDEVDVLLASVDSSSETYTSLTSIKALMESLANAFASYLSLLNSSSTNSGRAKRAIGKENNTEICSYKIIPNKSCLYSKNEPYYIYFLQYEIIIAKLVI